MSAVELVARRRLKHAGETVAPGATFSVDDPTRAELLCRTGYATATETSAETVAEASALRTSERARRAVRHPAPRLAPRERPAESLPSPTLVDGLHEIDNSDQTKRWRLAESRIAALEARVAELEAAAGTGEPEPAPAPRRLTRKATA